MKEQPKQEHIPLDPKYPKHTLLTNETRYVKVKTKNELKLSTVLPSGSSVNARIQDFDWGVCYTAFEIVDESVFSSSKRVGLVPENYLENVDNEILEDFNAKKFCL